MDLTTDASDYTLGSAMITLPPNDNEESIDLTIESNGPDLDLECFTLTLGDPGSMTATLDIFHTTTTICIKDDESKQK